MRQLFLSWEGGGFFRARRAMIVFERAVQWPFSRTPESNFKSNYLPLKSWKKSWKAPESNFHSMFSGPKSWIISWNIEYPEGNLWIKCSTQCSTFTPRKLGRGVGFSTPRPTFKGKKLGQNVGFWQNPTPRPTFRGWKVGQWVEHQMGADVPHDMQQKRRCLFETTP